jgi:NAD(P)-dependent dehydrogenase (short-subunit alcohol dehydrogenase family)
MSSKSPRCVVCKQIFDRQHWHYHQLCESCGEFNDRKQQETTDLTSKVALVTGGRVNIGYGVCLRLLRAGARVITTTRFPHRSAQQYSQEIDFENWGDRLQIYALDLRDLARVEAFTHYIDRTYPRLDIIINNAAQTIRRPPAYYRHLIELESQPLAELAPRLQVLIANPESSIDGSNFTSQLVSIPEINFVAGLSQIPMLPEDEVDLELFPVDKYDRDGNQMDLRSMNSWLLRDDEVSIVELLEVHVVNAIAPFVINSRLKGMMNRQNNVDRYIINVSSQEGRFEGVDKPWRHPHTNMAKAALNQMTRTCAKEYAKHQIFMNAVDPGWVSFQHPYPISSEMMARGTEPTFSTLDAAARICDPIWVGLNTGNNQFGRLFKDYQIIEWYSNSQGC